jgi:hypothetical protein
VTCKNEYPLDPEKRAGLLLGWCRLLLNAPEWMTAAIRGQMMEFERRCMYVDFGE